MPPSPSPTEVKARLRYLLHDADPPPSAPPAPAAQHSVSPTTPSSRLQALNLSSAPLSSSPTPNPPSFRLPPLPSPPPPLVPVRAHSADSAIVPPIANHFIPPQSVRSDSGISDITSVPNTARDAASFSSGPSFTATPPHSFTGAFGSQISPGPAHMDSNASSLTAPSPSVSATIVNASNIHSGFGAGSMFPTGTATAHKSTTPSGGNVRANSFAGSGVTAIGQSTSASNMNMGFHNMSNMVGGMGSPPGHSGMQNAVSALLASRRISNTISQGNSGNNSKSEAELRDKREMRRMKNRISAARSRQRKTDTFETLQRELAEAKTVIEALTRQLHRCSGGREHGAGQVGGTPSAPPAPLVIAVPQDLRPVMGRDFVSVDMLMDVLRVYIRRAQPA